MIHEIIEIVGQRMKSYGLPTVFSDSIQTYLSDII